MAGQIEILNPPTGGIAVQGFAGVPGGGNVNASLSQLSDLLLQFGAEGRSLRRQKEMAAYEDELIRGRMKWEQEQSTPVAQKKLIAEQLHKMGAIKSNPNDIRQLQAAFSEVTDYLVNEQKNVEAKMAAVLKQRVGINDELMAKSLAHRGWVANLGSALAANGSLVTSSLVKQGQMKASQVVEAASTAFKQLQDEKFKNAQADLTAFTAGAAAADRMVEQLSRSTDKTKVFVRTRPQQLEKQPSDYPLSDAWLRSKLRGGDTEAERQQLALNQEYEAAVGAKTVQHRLSAQDQNTLRASLQDLWDSAPENERQAIAAARDAANSGDMRAVQKALQGTEAGKRLSQTFSPITTVTSRDVDALTSPEFAQVEYWKPGDKLNEQQYALMKTIFDAGAGSLPAEQKKIWDTLIEYHTTGMLGGEVATPETKTKVMGELTAASGTAFRYSKHYMSGVLARMNDYLTKPDMSGMAVSQLPAEMQAQFKQYGSGTVLPGDPGSRALAQAMVQALSKPIEDLISVPDMSSIREVVIEQQARDVITAAQLSSGKIGEEFANTMAKYSAIQGSMYTALVNLNVTGDPKAQEMAKKALGAIADMGAPQLAAALENATLADSDRLYTQLRTTVLGDLEQKLAKNNPNDPVLKELRELDPSNPETASMIAKIYEHARNPQVPLDETLTPLYEQAKTVQSLQDTLLTGKSYETGLTERKAKATAPPAGDVQKQLESLTAPIRAPLDKTTRTIEAQGKSFEAMGRPLQEAAPAVPQVGPTSPQPSEAEQAEATGKALSLMDPIGFLTDAFYHTTSPATAKLWETAGKVDKASTGSGYPSFFDPQTFQNLNPVAVANRMQKQAQAVYAQQKAAEAQAQQDMLAQAQATQQPPTAQAPGGARQQPAPQGQGMMEPYAAGNRRPRNTFAPPGSPAGVA